MPSADGFQVIETLAATSCPPDLIIISGYDDRIIRAAVRSAEAVGLRVIGALEKPCTIPALLALIERCSARRETRPRDPSTLIRALASEGRLAEKVRTAFQSKRRLTDCEIVGYEALLRLTVDGEAINPEKVFGDGLDLDGQIEVTRLVLDDAMRFASILVATGRPAPVAVNCTPAIMCAPRFPDIVAEALERWNLPPLALQLELTEHESLHSFDRVAAAASRMALRDFRIVVDDFGRGTTSFERLLDLPLAELKVDKATFWQCVNGLLPFGMLEGVTQYCARRQIQSTIEGIETQDHYSFATSVGALQGQGYFWDRPAIANW